MAAIIVARGVEKRYGATTALAGVDLTIAPGVVYALLGPNGAGKTTLIHILTTLIRPDAGTVQIAGHDVVRQAAAVRPLIGVTFQDTTLDRELNARQILEAHARLYRISASERRQRIAALAALLHLEQVLERPARTLSGGMRRRLQLARSLLATPQVLFLDEPTTGLDPQNRSALHAHISDLARTRGMTVLLSTHAMDEAEAIAERVGIIDHGRLVAEGTPRSLTAALGADLVRFRGYGDSTALRSALGALPWVSRVMVDDASSDIAIGVDDGARRVAELVTWAQRCGYQVQAIDVRHPSLAEAFLAHTGVALRD